MKATLLKRARAHFYRPDVPAHIARHNVLAWALSVTLLGDRWLLAQPVSRI